jgi:hypothetical protein
MELKAILGSEIKSRVSGEVWAWLEEKVLEFSINPQSFNVAFAAVPRKTGRESVNSSPLVLKQIQDMRPGFDIGTWSLDRLARVWLVMNFPSDEQQIYIRTIENIFLTAEMNEQVALYSALPVLTYPEAWRHRCAEGIRSNIGVVLESIMCDNPYPSEQLDEAAWNQLVLKAIFTEKRVNKINGLDERANENLAHTLSDYAHERWAAHRNVNPLLWRCISGFVTDRIVPDIERLINSDLETERAAAALVIRNSTHPALVELGSKNAGLFVNMKINTWAALASALEPVSQ